MEKHLWYIDLFDCYGKILTQKQQNYFEAYYFENLTLSEIAINDNVSRNAVHKSLKEACEKLDFFEQQLHFINKRKQILELVSDELKNKIRDILY